eukprot:COSAG01_NODE_3069_length_6640_cov_2.893441_6_plen_48_part_00
MSERWYELVQVSRQPRPQLPAAADSCPGRRVNSAQVTRACQAGDVAC